MSGTPLRPTGRTIYVVRWRYPTGRVNQKYYVRPHYAHLLGQRLLDLGYEVRVFMTTAIWRASRGWP